MTQGTVKWFNAEKGFASIAERRAAGLADKRMALAQAPRARAPIQGTTVRTVRSANHSATTAAGSKRRFVIPCRHTPSGIGLVFSKASGQD